MKNQTTTTEQKFLYASAIVGIIAAVNPGDLAFNRTLIDDIATAAEAVHYLMDQVADEMQSQF